ncbi:MAG: glycosyltransferase family 4 protein [Alkalinema sp. RU_4_3]|nr:glycosyltransferase family 4 protein [Alkalinema sp. RU_4_3]
MFYPSQPRIHFWSPGLFDFKGGIQVFSGFLLKALQDLYPQVDCQAFMMHDRPRKKPPQYSHERTTFHYMGQMPLRLRTQAFATQVLGYGLIQKPNLVVTTHLNFTIAAYQLKRLRQIPYWTIAHGFEAWDIKRPQVLEALANADRILAVSSYTRDRLLENPIIDPDRVKILPNTFHPERFHIADKPAHLLTRHQLQPHQPIILTVNRLAAGESFHSYDQILKALPLIRQRIPDVHYLIVGQGDDRPRLEELIRHQNLTDCVTLAGFIPDAELVDYYNLCDVFAMPSTLEGFGIVYLEALACGKPVVAGLDGGVDALAQGRLGVNLDPKNIFQLANHLTEILQRRSTESFSQLLFDPQALRCETIQRFGTTAFRDRLANLLQSSPIGSIATVNP